MVRVNGQESEALVTHIDTEVDGKLGTLFIELDAPIHEAERWKNGRQESIEATWEPRRILYPAHEGLADILERCSVQGPFVSEAEVVGDRLVIQLRSAGLLKPLEAR